MIRLEKNAKCLVRAQNLKIKRRGASSLSRCTALALRILGGGGEGLNGQPQIQNRACAILKFW